MSRELSLGGDDCDSKIPGDMRKPNFLKQLGWIVRLKRWGLLPVATPVESSQGETSLLTPPGHGLAADHSQCLLRLAVESLAFAARQLGPFFVSEL
jgi:hypothetical protein